MSRHYCTQCGVAPTLALRWNGVLYFGKANIGLRRGVAGVPSRARWPGAPPTSGRWERSRAAKYPESPADPRADRCRWSGMEGFAMSELTSATAQNCPHPSDREVRAYFAELGRRSAAARRGGIVLTREEAAALAEAFAQLRRAIQRARRRCAAAEASAGEGGGDA